MIIFYIIIIVILVIFIILAFLSKKRNNINPIEVADIIERFLNGSGSKWEWDDFTSGPIKDHLLDRIRIHCSQLAKDYPPTKKGEYTNEKGLEILRRYVRELRVEHKTQERNKTLYISKDKY